MLHIIQGYSPKYGINVKDHSVFFIYFKRNTSFFTSITGLYPSTKNSCGNCVNLIVNEHHIWYN
jgi:hypothetical protein